MSKDKMIILPDIYQDNMMMQCGKDIPLKGNVQGSAEFIMLYIQDATGENTIYSAPVENGMFRVQIAPLKAGMMYHMSFFFDEQEEPVLMIRNILAGDIWLAGGQSNMEYFLRYDAHWQDIRKETVCDRVRMYNVPRIAFEGQKRENFGCGYWFEQGDEAWEVFSAPGYCFAREIALQNGIPVGVIGCNWGGTPASAWMEESYLREEPLTIYKKEYEESVNSMTPEQMRVKSEAAWVFEDSYEHDMEWRPVMYGLTRREQEIYMEKHKDAPELPMGPYHHYRPSGLYHTMIETIAPFPIKGILWYQGESDCAKADIYEEIMHKLLDCFRDTWKDPNLPFLYVQVAPYGQWLGDTGEYYPALRQSQDRASKSLKNAWMISVMDIGERDDIHPKLKREVGERLALLARGKVYGEDILCESPEICKVTVSEKEKLIRLDLLHAEGGVEMLDDAADLFEISKGDERLKINKISAYENQILLEMERIPENQGDFQLSFAHMPYCEVHIWNRSGLPLKPFTF